MKYMKVSNRFNDFTLIGCEIRAYDNAQDRQKALDHLFASGLNGRFCTRREVEQRYGKDFEIYREDENGDKYTHLDPFCAGVVDREFFKNRAYRFLVSST